MDFRLGLDPGSLETLVRLAGFAALLDPEVQAALTAAGTLLVNAAVANTWDMFANPTGTLASSIYFWVASPQEVDIAVGVPYGRRRELGYSGCTDIIGRYFADDPGKPYLQNALDDHRDAVRDLVAVGVEHALMAVGGA